MTKQEEASKRYWLDPQKNTTSIPVPPWEGTSNPAPVYMDLVLYNMHRVHKTKLKQFLQVHKQMSMEEVLTTFCYYEPDAHIACLPHNDKDVVLFVSKRELGHVIAYSKDAGEYDTRTKRVENKKWDHAIVEFENQTGWSVAKSVKVYGKISPGKKLLTMHDRNFILARACDMVEMDELMQHILEWKPEN